MPDQSGSLRTDGTYRERAAVELFEEIVRLLPQFESRHAEAWAKATELGAARLLPVMTQRTVTERVKLERLQAIAIEAAEQCGRTVLAKIDGPVMLRQLLADRDTAFRQIETRALLAEQELRATRIAAEGLYAEIARLQEELGNGRSQPQGGWKGLVRPRIGRAAR